MVWADKRCVKQNRMTREANTDFRLFMVYGLMPAKVLKKKKG